MKFGVFHSMPDASQDPAVVARRAEELGFDSYWLGEHVMMPVEVSVPYPGVTPGDPEPEYLHRIPEPLMSLARAGAVTDRLLLGTAICIVPQRNPLVLAKEISTLDHHTGGRFMFGVGAGWNREECVILGGDFEHRWSHVKDNVLAMKAAWTHEVAEYHGRYNDFPPLRMAPKPAQRPHPPVYLGSDPTREVAFKRVVEWGEGWMPNHFDSPQQIADGVRTLRTLAEDRGRDPDTIGTTLIGLNPQWGPATPAEVEALAETGIDRLILWTISPDLEGLMDELDSLATRYIG